MPFSLVGNCRGRLSAIVEIMFPKTMPRHKRMEVMAARGMKAFSFWGVARARAAWLSLSGVYGRSDCNG